jgi:hypothetical protein
MKSLFKYEASWMAGLAVLLCVGMPHVLKAQSVAGPATPVGRWVAEHPSSGGIGSWWEFRPDGTLTLYFGAMVTGAVSRTGDMLTMPSATIGGPPANVHFRVDQQTLVLIENGTESAYVRVGTAPSKSDLLVGTWRAASAAALSGDPKLAALEKARAQAVYVFSADGSESVRIPFGVREGAWDAKTHLIRFPKDPTSYTFELAGAKLVLGQPPDGKTTDTYLRDPVQHP